VGGEPDYREDRRRRSFQNSGRGSVSLVIR
jgi:hypothetical protein